jgi:5-methylthioadenosine/S-adenosylhomocysteine deaminase
METQKSRKIDLLITDGTIITMDEMNTVIHDGTVAIHESRIIDIGPREEIDARYQPSEKIDASDHIVMPGLIDTHYHTGQQFERNLMSYLSRENLVKDPVWLHSLVPFEGSLSDDDIHLSALFGYANLIKVGTTCFADPGGPRPEFMAPAVEETGIRGILARSTLDTVEDVPPEMQDTIEGIIQKGQDFHNKWNGRAGGRLKVWLGMRQIMVCSRELLKALRQLANELKTGIHIHLSEQTTEVEYAIVKSGKRPAAYLEEEGFLGADILAAHSVLLSDHDLDIYQKYDVAVAHCPAIFAFTGAAKIPEMLKRGIRVGLGSDGPLSSGGSLDLFRQMTITRYGQTVIFGLPYDDREVTDDVKLLRMATIGGAKAISWSTEIGSLEIGKKADLICINLNDLDIMPSYDPINTAAQVAQGHHVDTVIVDGKVLMKNRQLLTIDEEALMDQIKQRGPTIVRRFLDKVAT